MALDGLTFLDASRRMPLMDLPLRTTVVTLDGARILHSPSSTMTEAQLASLGGISDIVAPNLLHTEGMPAAARAHPKARLWGPVGVREKRPELKWHGILGSDAWPYDSELAHITVDGMPEINESVFLHTRSRTLLVSDLVFNIERPSGAGAWLILHLFGTWKRFAVSRLFLKYVKDRAATQRSLEQLSALDFDAVVPAHGNVVESGGKAKFLASLRERGYGPAR